jgi:hypothetical protein
VIFHSYVSLPEGINKSPMNSFAKMLHVSTMNYPWMIFGT